MKSWISAQAEMLSTAGTVGAYYNNQDQIGNGTKLGPIRPRLDLNESGSEACVPLWQRRLCQWGLEFLPDWSAKGGSDNTPVLQVGERGAGWQRTNNPAL